MDISLFRRQHRTAQRGAASVEFAIGIGLFIALVLGIIEFGRMLYVWNTVQEVTRRAAREAVVNFTTARPAIQRDAVFHAGSSDIVTLPAALEISNATIRIRYLNSIGASAEATPSDPGANMTACLTSLANANCINFVEVRVCADASCSTPVQYVPMLPIFSFLAFDIPSSTVVMPAESLGFVQ